MNTSKLNTLASIALASYADHASEGKPQGADLAKSGFAQPQALEFADAFSVVIPTYHDPASDLDVTVFKAADGSLSLGIRETLEPLDLIDADADILTKGAAYSQIVALYNWWQRVSSPTSKTDVKQFTIEGFSVGQTVPSSAVVLYTTVSSGANEAALPITYYLVQANNVSGNGQLVTALAADPDHKIDVAGHSLGGQTQVIVPTCCASSSLTACR